MATQTYMYLNNGTKVPVYGNANTHSMPYRAYVTETVKPKTSTSTKSSSGSGQTAATVSAVAYDDSAAKLAAEMRAQREAEERRRQEKINAINANKQREIKLLGETLEASKKAAKLNNSENLRQLYIAYMQGLKGIPQLTAVWGAGGEIESLKNKSRLNYESNRAEENRNHEDIMWDIQQRYNNDLNELERKYLQQMLDV